MRRDVSSVSVFKLLLLAAWCEGRFTAKSCAEYVVRLNNAHECERDVP